MMRQITVLATAVAVLMFGCSPGQTQEDKAQGGEKSGPSVTRKVAGAAQELQTHTTAGVSFQTPSGWVSSTPSSNMRAAQFTLPAAKGDADSPELVLYFFGEGQGGDPERNVERWISQMEQPGGGSSRDQAKREQRQVEGFRVSTVRLNGTYASTMMPGMGAGESKPGYRMWGAVVEGKGGPWFFKATGPQASVEAAEPDLDGLVASLKPATE
jgi:hypothetical protein